MLFDYSKRDDFRRKSLALNVITIPPQSNHPPQGIVVALHGWGSNARDLASLVPLLNLPEYLFLFPDAPLTHPSAPGGFMWYDFQAGYRGLEESRQLLKEWLKSLAAETGVPFARTVLVGFSQGGAMTLDVGLNLPLGGLVALSGYLHPLDSDLSHTPPVLIIHGRQDQVVPLSSAQSARKTLTQAGAKVEYHELEMGHEIQPSVLPLLHNFIQTAVSTAETELP